MSVHSATTDLPETQIVICPSCQSDGTTSFYETLNVPAHSVLLMETSEKAIGYPSGDILLKHCNQCGFIFNGRFEQELNEYCQGYEETQHFSPTFSRFAERLCDRLIDEYEIRHKTIVEIGCGKGEFLAELCLRGQNTGIGIDPACAPARLPNEVRERVEFRSELFDQNSGELDADVVCCRHTLEHIGPVMEFLQQLRRSIDPDRTQLVFFEVPAAEIILQEQRFWDIYYEHCSYFTEKCLKDLFVRCGFEVHSVERAFDQQYFLLFARRCNQTPVSANAHDAAETQMVEQFKQGIEQKRQYWRAKLTATPTRRIALWGAGSKCVSLLTSLDVDLPNLSIVDINPHKQGKFLPGTGQRVDPPEHLTTVRPDEVIIMNPVYLAEIKDWLNRHDLNPEIDALS